MLSCEAGSCSKNEDLSKLADAISMDTALL
jgi:hypothetical protein